MDTKYLIRDATSDHYYIGQGNGFAPGAEHAFPCETLVDALALVGLLDRETIIDIIHVPAAPRLGDLYA